MTHPATNAIAALVLLTLGVSSASAQTTQLQQTGPDHCVVNGCVNAPLIDGETYSWSDTPITATAPTAPPLGAPTPVTVTATFPDGTAATMTVTVGTIPASPPPEN